MGPQPFGCGRLVLPWVLTVLCLLQWGRNLSVAEGAGADAKQLASNPLQWGRNLSVAEGTKYGQ